MWLDRGSNAPEIPDSWSYCEVHGYDGDIMDILYLLSETEQKIKFEPLYDRQGNPVAKITPRYGSRDGISDFREVFGKVVEVCPQAEILFF